MKNATLNDNKSVNVQITPLPKKKLTVIVLMMLSSSIAITIVFPIAPFMVLDWGVATEENVGSYSGLIMSAMQGGRVCTTLLWGHLSDTMGRRSIILGNLAAATVFLTLFAFSPSYKLALFFRFMQGICNASISVCKTYISDICDNTNQTKAFSFVAISWSLGLLLGPALSGWLAKPNVAPDTLFDHYPYLPPLLVCLILNVVSLVLGLLFLEETVINVKGVKGKSSSTSTEMKNVNYSKLELKEEEGEEEEVIELDSSTSNDVKIDIVKDSKDTTSIISEIDNPNNTLMKTLLTPTIRNLLIIYFVTASLYIGFDEVYVLFALIRTENGGLGFSTKQIGTSQAISGFFLLSLQLFFFSRFTNRFGAKKSLMTGSMVGTICLPLIPLLHKAIVTFSDSTTIQWIFISMAMLARAFGTTLHFVCIFLMLTNASPPSRKGAVNGAGQFLASVGRTISPAAAGYGFTLSFAKQIPWFMFALFGSLDLIVFGLAYGLPSKVVDKKRD